MIGGIAMDEASLQELLSQRFEVYIKLEELQNRLKEIDAILIELYEAGEISLQGTGLSYHAGRSGGYSDGIIPLLKSKGLYTAIQVTEKPKANIIADLIAAGQLLEEEVEEFRKPSGSPFLSVRGK